MQDGKQRSNCSRKPNRSSHRDGSQRSSHPRVGSGADSRRAGRCGCVVRYDRVALADVVARALSLRPVTLLPLVRATASSRPPAFFARTRANFAQQGSIAASLPTKPSLLTTVFCSTQAKLELAAEVAADRQRSCRLNSAVISIHDQRISCLSRFPSHARRFR
jgi:hypothetical protein